MTEFEKKFGEKVLVELPKRIESPYPYLVLGDLPEVGDRLLGFRSDGILELQRDVFRILEVAKPSRTTFYTALTEKMNRDVEMEISSQESGLDGSLGIIQMDRYIGEEIGGTNYFRMNISRGVDGGLMPRPGTTRLPEDQVKDLAEWAKIGGYKKLLFVDDVLAFGDTLSPLITMVQNVLPNAEMEVLVGVAASGGGWNGKERVEQETGIKVTAMCISVAGEENDWTSGMAIPTSRDFTFLGGKVMFDANRGYDFNFPYFLPYSVPVLSFMGRPKRMEISWELMNASRKGVITINKERGNDLLLGELVAKGFGVPMTRLQCLNRATFNPDPYTSVLDYLDYYQKLFEKNYSNIHEEIIEKGF